MALDVVSQSRCFDGTQLTYQHQVPKQEHFGLGAGFYVDANATVMVPELQDGGLY